MQRLAQGSSKIVQFVISGTRVHEQFLADGGSPGVKLLQLSLLQSFPVAVHFGRMILRVVVLSEHSATACILMPSLCVVYVCPSRALSHCVHSNAIIVCRICLPIQSTTSHLCQRRVARKTNMANI